MYSKPPLGFIHLILLPQENPFYLEIPTAILATVCLNQLKYLQYLGWCVLGIVGVLKDGQGNEIMLNGKLVDQGVYHYIVPDQNILAHAVDLAVIKQQTHWQVPSETTETLKDFSTAVLERDGHCVWTGVCGIGMHIIPYGRGNEWLQLILDNRPHDEDLDFSINDIQNGIYADNNLHTNHFDLRHVVILKTPNPILDPTDVPERCQRNIISDVSYPTDSRYTLQWIVTPPHDVFLDRFPNNNDATFKDQNLPKPADVLLHYNYGVAAVKQWGKNVDILTKRPDIPRPPIPAPAPLSPTRIKHNRNISIQKRSQAATTSQGGESAGSKRKRGEGAGLAAQELDVQERWDEDDVVLFLWSNTKAALERQAQKKQERMTYLEDWRAAVTGVPDTV